MTRPIVLLGVAGYVLALTLANLLVAQLGPPSAPAIAFVLIGFDLAMRNRLQVELDRGAMAWLILGAGAVTLVVNPAAHQIAVASCVAFICAAGAEWFTFSVASGTWLQRSVAAALVGAAIDSLIFPTLAFGMLLPGIMAAQFAAKAIGGTLWSFVLKRRAA